MAYTDRNIVITPNIGQASAEPIIRFTGGGSATSATIYARVLDAGSLSFEATAGQVHSISDGLTGSIFAVNDVSGIPSVEVFDTGAVQLAKYQGVVQIGANTQSTTTATGSLQVLGGVGISGNLNIGGAFNLSANLAVGGSASTYGLNVNTSTNVAAWLTTNAGTGMTIQTGAYRGIGFNSYTLDGSTYYVMTGAGYNGQIQLQDSNGFKFLVSSASQSAGAVATQFNALNVSYTGILVPLSTAATSTATGAISTYGGISSGGAHWAGADSYFNSVRIGQGNLASTSNTVVGNSAGSGLTTGGTANTLIGYNSGNGVTTGGNNTLIGNSAGQLIGAGASNTGIGTNALAAATGASVTNNTAIGYRALGSGTLLTGGNTAIGTNALLLLASGSNNTAIGYGAGSTISANSTNVMIGYNAGNALGYDNCTIIGGNSGATMSAAGQIIIATGNGTSRIFIDQNGQVQIASATAASTTNTAGALYTTGGASIQGGLNLGGALYAQNSAGTNGYFLQTTGSGVQWAQAGVSITDDTSTNATRYPLFSSSISGAVNTEYTSSSKLTYNPSTGRFSATQLTGTYVGINTTTIGSASAVLNVAYVDASTNLQRWGDGTAGAAGYRLRVDQNYALIGNNGTSDNFTVTTSNGSVTTPGSYTSTSGAAYAFYASQGAVGTGGDIGIRSSAPTIHFRDIDQMNAYLHNNSNLLYVLRGAADSGAGGWTQVNSQWPFTFNLSDNSATCGGTFYSVGDVYSATSDERLKDIEGPITDALSKVMQLQGFYYRNNDLAKSLGVMGDRRMSGLSAQKLKELFPETVVPAPFDINEKTGESKSGENYLTAQYERVVPLLVEAIKEQQGQIQAQATQIEQLTALVNQLLNK